MTVNLVGGFLGSGKTTAIIGAARLLASRGVTVGVVTNDQGSSLVDTELVRSSGLSVSEVTGGCFCCNFPDFQKMIETMERGSDAGSGPRSHAGVIFAEPVGSCADLVATVLKPLAASRGSLAEVGRLSVFTDIRLIRQRLFGRALPFSDDVLYIFDSQIEEAEVLVLNKSDLLPAQAATEVMEKARERYPGKTVRLQSSFRQGELEGWVDILSARGVAAGRKTVPVDYDRYANGEMSLAWYDAFIVIDLPAEIGREVAERLMDALRSATQRRGRPLGHVKIFVRHEAGAFKTSIWNEKDDPEGLRLVAGSHLEVTINARTEDSAEGLRSAIREAVSLALSEKGVSWKVTNEESFHPSRPRPFLRMA
jgi:Ni2+-binding GTPase involved in maturation of urease and hydrogenase